MNLFEIYVTHDIQKALKMWNKSNFVQLTCEVTNCEQIGKGKRYGMF